MKFKREHLESLKSWKSGTKHKPVLLMGARQIGKTTLLKEFGQSAFDNLVYVNFEKDQTIHQFFEGNKNPKDILDNLSIHYGQPIEVGATLLILDEIQDCRDALIALKYFEEDLPGLHIACAGSLLGLSIGNDRSFPVGKVTFIDLQPLSYSEYLEQAHPDLYQAYWHHLDKPVSPIPDAFFHPLTMMWKEYVLFGGMPEVAVTYNKSKNIAEALEVQEQILRAYQLDFVKHAEKTTSTRIQHIWNSLPSQLAKENNKFLYKVIKSGARAREYESALQWLVESGLVIKTSKIEEARIPLKAYEDLTSFKIYAFETGLLIRHSGLNPGTYLQGDKLFTEYKGSLAENYVASVLNKLYRDGPYYWTSHGKAEVDFVIEPNGQCIPIEVKSGTRTKAKSLSVFKERYQPPIRIRISNRNLKLTDDILNIPLFYADHIDHFLSKIL